jgi:hypothetical protein
MNSNELLASLNADVMNEAFEIARTNIPGVIGTIKMGASRIPESGSKLSWMDMQISAGGDTVNGAIANNVTTLVVDDGSKFRAGMQISVKDSDEVMLVTAVSTNSLTVTRGFGGTTAVAIVDDAVVTIDSVGRGENSLGEDDGIVEPTPKDNLFQTFDTQLNFSRRMMATAQHGNMNSITTQISERMKQLMIQMNRALIKGRKATATVGSDSVTFVGGVKYYLDQTGALNVDNSGAVLTETKLDDLSEAILLAGGTSDTIAVNTRLGRKLTALMRANFQSQRLSESQDDKGAVSRIVSDLPLVGNVNQIVIDTNLNDDELIMYDSSMIEIIPMGAGNGEQDGNWQTKDATAQGQDGVKVRIIGDFSFEIKQAETHFHRLYNIG